MEIDPLVPGPERHLAVREMFDRIAPRYEQVNRVITFGLDRGWRRRTVSELGLAAGSVVLDVGCGTGDLSRALWAAGLRGIGFDLSEGMLRAAAGGPFALADGMRLPVPDAVADGATCGFALRNVVDLSKLLAELGRVLRPGGRLALLEVAEPRWQPARSIHRLYFHRVVPLVGGALSDRQAYRYLPASSALLPSSGELAALVEAAGFEDRRCRMLALGAAQLLTATRG